jgi:hypothetical protein
VKITSVTAHNLTDLLLYRLTVESNERLNGSSMMVRGLARQLRPSPAQIYRRLDTTNYRKSIGQMLDLVYHLDGDVEFVVRPRAAVSARYFLLAGIGSPL